MAAVAGGGMMVGGGAAVVAAMIEDTMCMVIAIAERPVVELRTVAAVMRVLVASGELGITLINKH